MEAGGRRHYNHTLAINNQGSVMAYRQNYLDLDPTYRDRYGRPLMRMTFDYHANEQKQANYIADICVKIGEAMGAERVVRRAGRRSATASFPIRARTTPAGP